MEFSEGKKAVVIYHANCMDGFASAWAFHTLKEKDYPGGVEYIPANYGKDFPPFPDGEADLFILDFSYPEEQLGWLCQSFDKVTVLDHHKTAQENLQKLLVDEFKPLNLEIVFDMERSGAGITWDYFKNATYGGRPSLINFVEDRDLWKFKLPVSKQINAVIAIADFNFKSWDDLAHDLATNQHGVGEAGRLLDKQHQKICESICEDARSCQIQTSPESIHHGLVANCTAQFASEVGNILAGRSGTYGATYFTNGQGETKWSLRSRGDYDVSVIARIYGGGGHQNAAGFVIPADSELGVGVHIWNNEASWMESNPTPWKEK